MDQAESNNRKEKKGERDEMVRDMCGGAVSSSRNLPLAMDAWI